MKKAFPGDLEYSWDRFCQLPYEYVLTGYTKMLELRKDELHELELPSGTQYCRICQQSEGSQEAIRNLLAQWTSPSTSAWRAKALQAIMPHATLQLIKDKLLPPWALFCYKEIAPSATGRAGRLSILVSEDAVLVGPRKVEEGYKGLLIALESASGQTRMFHGPDGEDL